MTRYRIVIWILTLLLGEQAHSLRAESTIATFFADITIPIGHPCMGGGVTPAHSIQERLQAKGFVLTLDDQKAIVMISLDWCEVRGSLYDDWRRAIAKELNTDPQRVLVSSTHVHDAPVMDAEAEFLLHETEKLGHWKELPPPELNAAIQLASVCWPDFNRICIQRVLVAMREGLTKKRPVTHFGLGKAKVDRVASNRRFLLPDGTVSYGRYSSSGNNPQASDGAEGEIDPWLRTLSFWNGDTPLCALHSYAVHPMSYYGKGEVSIDFIGLAREQLQQDTPSVLQIYATGCAGNVTAGKYNDGRPPHRVELAARLHSAMTDAWENTHRHPLTTVKFRNVRIPLSARNTEFHTEAFLRQRLTSDPNPFHRAEAAMGLAWYERVTSGHQIDLPLLDFGPAQLLLLPAETYVEFQLYAQQLRPENFVMCLGYGECGPGYIPIERAWREKDQNLSDWAWVGPGSEETLKKSIREILAPSTFAAQASQTAISNKQPVKVFILAGQSNMEGQAVVDLTGKDYNDGKGTLVSLMNDPTKAPMFSHLKGSDGKWTVRDEVFVRYQREQRPLLKGPLSFGFSVYGDVHHFGPELQFGHVLGDALDNPVLLIKTAWGGKSLYKDFRPPSSGGAVGKYYTLMIEQVRDALVHLESDFPSFKGLGHELSGFVWYQGWNDGVNPKTAVPEYEQNLVNLIKDVRKEFQLPKLPVVIGELTGPWVQAEGGWDALRKAQLTAARRPEFAGNVLYVPTHDFVRKAEDSPNIGHGHHEFGNAETYFLVGDALGKGMLQLMK